MKLIKLLLGIIVAVVVIILAAAIFLAIMILDFNVVEPDYLNDSTTIELSTETSISRALSYAKTDSKINFYLSEEELNIILKASSKQINKALGSISGNIEALYVDILNNNDIKYTCYISFYGLTTSIKGEFKYREGLTSFVFGFSNFNIGSLNLKTSLFKSAKINDKNINDYLLEALKDSNLKAYFSDNGDFNITISHDFVQELLFDSVKDSDFKFLSPVVNAILNSGKTIGFAEDKFNFGINVSPFEFDYTKDYYNAHYFSCENAKFMVEKLLNDNVITPDKTNLVANYLMLGYDSLNDSDKNTIKAINLSSVEILNNESYKGMIEYDERDIDELLLSEKLSDNTLIISQEYISNFFLKEGIVGQMNCFVREDNDKYNVAFIGIEDMYIDIWRKDIYFYFNVSIDGMIMPIVLTTYVSDTTGLKTVLKINGFRIGSQELNNSQEIVDFLSANVNLEWFYFNASENQIIIDFNNVFINNPELNLLLNDRLTMVYNGDSTSGYIEFLYSN